MASKNPAKTKAKLSGSDGFEVYYSNLYKDRWPSLKEALFKEPKYVAWNTGEGEPYYLDSGSVLAALSLPLSEQNRILDMCAAPGGKSLVIASRMSQESTLTSNERSSQRKIRLNKVIQEHFSEEIRQRIYTTGFDAAKWCLHETEVYDRILLDAPCSSERHVINDCKYLDEWSPSRIKSLAIEQYALISSAFRVLKQDGYMMYATCALAYDENDAVIKRLCKKFPNVLVQNNLNTDFAAMNKCANTKDLPLYEKTEYGFYVLPDKQEGAGPLFFSIIQKTKEISC